MSDKINKCGCGGSLPIEVFEQAEFKAYCVLCRTCGCKGGTAPDKINAIRYWNTAHPEYEPMQKKQYIDFLQSLSDTCNISQYAFDTLSVFDYPIFEKPTISNAMQAVKWLEEGKKLHQKDSICYYAINEQCISSYLKNNNEIYTLSDEHYFFMYARKGLLQFYEEPKYEKVEYINALQIYLENPAANIKAYFEDEEYKLQENEDDGIGLYSSKLNEGKSLTTEIIKSAEWRRYEDFIERSPL